MPDLLGQTGHCYSLVPFCNTGVFEPQPSKREQDGCRIRCREHLMWFLRAVKACLPGTEKAWANVRHLRPCHQPPWLSTNSLDKHHLSCQCQVSHYSPGLSCLRWTQILHLYLESYVPLIFSAHSRQRADSVQQAHFRSLIFIVWLPTPPPTGIPTHISISNLS